MVVQAKAALDAEQRLSFDFTAAPAHPRGTGKSLFAFAGTWLPHMQPVQERTSMHAGQLGSIGHNGKAVQ